MDLKQAKAIANAQFRNTTTTVVTETPRALTIFNALFNNEEKVFGETIHYYRDENKHTCANVTIIKTFNYHLKDGSVMKYPGKYRYQTQETTTGSAYATLAKHGKKIMWVFCDAIQRGDKWVSWKDTKMDNRRECAGMVIDGTTYTKPEHEQPYIADTAGVQIPQKGIHNKLVMEKPLMDKPTDDIPIDKAMSKIAEEVCSNYPDSRREQKCDLLAATFELIAEQASNILILCGEGVICKEQMYELLVDWKEENSVFITASLGMANMIHSVDYILSNTTTDREEEIEEAAEELSKALNF